MINLETEEITIEVAGLKSRRRLNILDIGSEDLIIGLDWLQQNNPVIDWRTGDIRIRPSTLKVNGVRKAGNPCTPREGRFSRISFHKIMKIYEKTPEEVRVLWLRRVDPKTVHQTKEVEIEIPKEYREYAGLFKENEATALPKHQPWDHEISIQEGVKLKPGPMFPVSREQEEELRQYIEKNLKKRYIRHSQSPMASPVLFVPKKNGKWRLCVDYRHLNNATVKDRYPLPLISELMDRLQGVKWFTKFDIREGYYRIRIAEGHEWKTAFKTRYGLFEYCVMPFGLTNAPATFQSVINNALREYLDVFVTAYLDDVLVYSKGTLEEHIEHVKKVLAKLKEYDLLVQPEKCEFHVTRTEFLGFIVSREGIEMDPSKTKAVQEWPVPTNVKGVQSFLGFANFLRKFIKDYSRITIPLSEITKQNIGFHWGDKQQQAFEELKEKFLSAPILRLFDPELEIRIYTDASDFAIGCCCFQIHKDGKMRPVAFHSRKLTPAELNYDIHDKELMAIVAAFEEWSTWLQGPKYPVTVFSDHLNLTSFLTTKKLNRRQVRWAEELAIYNFKIVHCKGTENGAADALSRRDDYMEHDKPTYDAVLRKNPDGSLEYNHPRLATITIIEDKWEKRIQDCGPQFWDKGRLEVPEELQTELIKEKHAAIAHGHQGVEKTLERISRNYYFPGMRRKVEAILKDCLQCGLNKSSRHRPYGLLQPLTPPAGPWQSITMDFIVKLPESTEPGTGRICDSVLVVVCRLTKYAYFLPLKESITAEDLAYEILRSIVSRHGMPKEIISDRDKLFTSKFWNSLISRLGCKLKLSTSFHPQTDGQTERANQTLEQYLRMYVDYAQDNWVELLPTAQFAHNSSKSATTGHTPFYANYGYEPTAYGEARKTESLSEQAREKADRYVEMCQKLQEAISQRNQITQRNANKSRVEGPTFREGDRVFLTRGKAIKTKRPSGKLDNVKLGPFEIKKVVGPVNYELCLPKSMRIHPVFHISRLEPAPQDAELAKDIQIEVDETDYEVEAIRDLRKFGSQWKYLVKWAGYGETDNTWEPLKNLKGCQKMVNQYHQQHPGKGPKQKGKPKRTSQPPGRVPQSKKQRQVNLRALNVLPPPTSPTLQSKKAHDESSHRDASPNIEDASLTALLSQKPRHEDDEFQKSDPEPSSLHDPDDPSQRKSPPDCISSSDQCMRNNDQTKDLQNTPEEVSQCDKRNKEWAWGENGKQPEKRESDDELQRKCQSLAWRKGRKRGMYDLTGQWASLHPYTRQASERINQETAATQCDHSGCHAAWKHTTIILGQYVPLQELRKERVLCLRDESKEGRASVTSKAHTKDRTILSGFTMNPTARDGSEKEKAEGSERGSDPLGRKETSRGKLSVERNEPVLAQREELDTSVERNEPALAQLEALDAVIELLERMGRRLEKLEKPNC